MMPKLSGFQERSSSGQPGFTPPDTSPDSVIFTLDSNFSLFSSTSASVDRRSLASDAHDPDFLASETSLHLAGYDHEFFHSESWSGPNPDPNEPALHNKKQVQKDDNNDADDDIEDGNQLLQLDSARNSFSPALKERQNRSSEAFLKKTDRRRPASLDLNNETGTSPRPGGLRKSSVSSLRSDTFPSPGTPDYRKASAAMLKGWSSERAPSHTNTSRKYVTGALLPLKNGRTLPSKWEDAERWILSPISRDSIGKASLPPLQRKPKSKSGPLGPPGVAYYSMYSPAQAITDRGNAGSFMAGSPFSAEAISADSLTIHSSGLCGVHTMQTESCMARSVSMHGRSEMHSQLSMPSQEEKFDNFKDAATNVSGAVLRRDMATQMSPEDSQCSSPNTTFFTSTPSVLPITELQGISSSKMDIRDVQVDERVTMTRWSKKNRAIFSGRGSENVDRRKKKEIRAHSSSRDLTGTSKTLSKAKREEAKIIAWENLQKAKAEAAIRKLEMKLEKKRASSMDKIMTKLRSAQKKAREMRSSVLANEAHEVARTPHKAISFRRNSYVGCSGGCFTCHVF